MPPGQMYSFKGPDDTGMLTDKNTQLLNTYLSIYGFFLKKGESSRMRVFVYLIAVYFMSFTSVRNKIRKSLLLAFRH